MISDYWVGGRPPCPPSDYMPELDYVFSFLKQLRLFSRLCCQCGVPITPNPANMCVACIRTQVDIAADIPKQVVIYFCRFCER